MHPSGPSGKFCNAQPRHKHCGQGAVRREWQALSKGCNTAHDACGAALREPLCECDSVLRFLPREGPLPAKRALIRTRTVALNVTELSTWPTSSMRTVCWEGCCAAREQQADREQQ